MNRDSGIGLTDAVFGTRFREETQEVDDEMNTYSARKAFVLVGHVNFDVNNLDGCADKHRRPYGFF